MCYYVGPVDARVASAYEQFRRLLFLCLFFVEFNEYIIILMIQYFIAEASIFDSIAGNSYLYV